MNDQASKQADIEFALRKTGIDLAQARRDRLAAEAAEIAKIEDERRVAVERGRRARNERADAELLSGLNEYYFVSLDERRIGKIRSIESLKCPSCGSANQASLANAVRDFALNESVGGDILAQSSNVGNQRVVWQAQTPIVCPACTRPYILWCERLRRPSALNQKTE